MAQLPPTLDELIAVIEAAQDGEDHAGRITYEFADRLGALRHCDVCGRPIVEITVLVGELLEHYGLNADTGGRLEDALRRSRLEAGDTLSPNYCSYHAQITSE